MDKISKSIPGPLTVDLSDSTAVLTLHKQEIWLHLHTDCIQDQAVRSVLGESWGVPECKMGKSSLTFATVVVAVLALAMSLGECKTAAVPICLLFHMDELMHNKCTAAVHVICQMCTRVWLLLKPACN